MGWELPSRNDDTECRKPHGQSVCIRQKDHDGGCGHNERVLAARREGVIEGLERALTLFPNAHAVTQWDPQDAIRDTLERLRAEQKEG